KKRVMFTACHYTSKILKKRQYRSQLPKIKITVFHFHVGCDYFIAVSLHLGKLLHENRIITAKNRRRKKLIRRIVGSGYKQSWVIMVTILRCGDLSFTNFNNA